MDATKEATLARYRQENQTAQPGWIIVNGVIIYLTQLDRAEDDTPYSF